MPPTVLLEDIVEALQLQFDEYSAFLDLDTGKVQTVSDTLLSAAEELEDDQEPDLPEWQEEEWEIAQRIVSTDRYKRLPSKFDVHEWAIMEAFTRSPEAGRFRDDLEFAIHGAGAFRHFKKTIRRHGLEQSWYKFRDEALREIAIDWCEENGIAWQ